MPSDLRFKPKDLQDDPSSAATTSRVAGDMQKILSTAAVFLDVPEKAVLIEESRGVDGLLLAARFREKPESELSLVYATRTALALWAENDPSKSNTTGDLVVIPDLTSVHAYLANQPQKQAVLAQYRRNIMEKVVWSYA